MVPMWCSHTAFSTAVCRRALSWAVRVARFIASRLGQKPLQSKHRTHPYSVVMRVMSWSHGVVFSGCGIVPPGKFRCSLQPYCITGFLFGRVGGGVCFLGGVYAVRVRASAAMSMSANRAMWCAANGPAVSVRVNRWSGAAKILYVSQMSVMSSVETFSGMSASVNRLYVSPESDTMRCGCSTVMFTMTGSPSR